MAGLRSTFHLLKLVAAISLLYGTALSPIKALAEEPPSLEQLEQQATAGDAEAMKKLGELLLKTGKTPAEREKGVERLEQAIAAGRADAMVALGTAYLWGNGVERNPEKAEALLTRAAETGHAGARRTLGEQLITGWVLLQQTQRGLSLIEEGVAKGDVKSKGILGRLLLEGKYLKQDSARGLALLEEAIAGKDDAALSSLGLAYLTGTGVAPNPDKARELLSQAASAGSNSARRQLGEALIKGQGVGKNTQEGLRLLNEAVAASDLRAHLLLGELLLDGNYVTPNRKQAARVLLAHDKLSHGGEGTELLGSEILKAAKTKKDLLLAEEYLRTAGEAGRGSAWLTLARAASRGKLAGNSPRKYRDYAEKCRKAGVEGIALVEAQRHEWGFGTRANGKKAIDILADAAKDGNKQAVRYLVKVTRDGDGWKIKPDRKAAGRYLERYGDVLPAAERTSMSLLIRASGSKSPQSLAVLAGEIESADVSRSASFQKDLFAANPNLSVYLLQRHLKSQQLFNGQMSGMFTKPTLRAIREACSRQTGPVRCGKSLMSADTAAAILTQ